ncbi:MAG: DUF3617 domain-containing protein [Steroidobacteraceae bacterium]
MSKSWFGRLAAAASLLCLVIAPAQAQEKGELWETTSQAQIKGSPMQMPAIFGQHCAKKDWTQAPASGDPSQHCKNTDFNRSGDKATWSVVCDNPPMTGQGELTFNGPDAYAGVLRFQTDQMNMEVNMTGKKIGTCDNPQ